MTPVFSSGFQPDPASALDVLAFVFCPLELFGSGDGSQEEREAIAELMAPAKQQAIRRWQEVRREQQAN